jgi:hypothetical protein
MRRRLLRLAAAFEAANSSGVILRRGDPTMLR